MSRQRGPDVNQPPGDVESLAQTLLAAGDVEAGYRLLKSACLSEHCAAATWFLFASVCARLDRLDEVIEGCRRTVELDPQHARAWYNLGVASFKLGRFEEAISVYQSALAIEPNAPGTLGNLGAAWLAAGNPDRALDYCTKAIELDPRAVTAINTLGIAYRESGRYPEALATFERGVQIEPQHVELNWNRALALLKCGDFQRGWDAFEWRWQYATGMQRATPYPRWQGLRPAKPLLVYMEQGIGDQIMFASCLQDLQAGDSQVIVECAPRLVPLFARSFPGMRFHGGSWDERQPACRIPIQRQIPMGSLPRLFRRERDAFPERTGYLQADAARVADWRSVLAAVGPGPKIGISWRGGSDACTRAKRSIALPAWRKLIAADTTAVFIDVQYGDRDADLCEARALGMNIHTLQGVDAMTDLDGFAALLAALDLVVTVDNSTLHLAGAIGVEAWGLLPYDADWRWEAGAGTTVWYPNVRLFHQRERTSWAGLLENVSCNLAQRAAASAALKI